MNKTMLAAVFEKEGVLALKNMPVPVIGKDDDVIIRVEAASICGSDLKILEVPPAHPAKTGVIMGHEYLGTVVEAGDAVSALKAGDRVVVEPNIPCGECPYCKENIFHMCANLETLGETLDGGFAEYNLAPAGHLHKVPGETPVEEAVFTEPLTCALGAFQKINVKPADTVIVFGAGPLGLLFLQLFIASGARTMVAEPAPDRRRVAELCGAEVVVDPLKSGWDKAVADFAPPGVHFAVDTVGSVLSTAMPLLRRYGTLILFGVNDLSEATIKQYDITRNNLRILGSFIGVGDFPKAIDIIHAKKIDVRNLISTQLPLQDISKGIDLLRQRKAIKVIISP
jgi:threonine dehydrogenase-like Zn-dependent dehydrogenase